MRLGIVRLYTGESGKAGYYNMQELGLAKELVSTLSIEVIIFILRNRKKYPDSEIIDIEENIKIVYLPVMTIGNHGLLNPNKLSRFNLDIIQLNSDNQIGCSKVINWSLKKGIPIYTYIGTISSDSNNIIKRSISNGIVKFNCRMMKKIINVAKTPAVLEELKNLGIRNTSIIPVGLDIDNFIDLKESDSNQTLKDKYRVPKNKKILIFVGRLETYKKPLVTLDLFSYIKQQGKNYHLLVVGDGSLKFEFLNKIKTLNIQNDVTYIEQIENKYMHELYKISDIFINTNEKEIYGMSILEAMYCGCPVVAKKAPGPSYIISNGDTGYIIDNYDKDDWYERIEDIILYKEKFSLNSTRRIINNFTWDIICNKYNDLFNQLKA